MITLYALKNPDRSVSVLNAAFQRLGTWDRDASNKPMKGQHRVVLNCNSYNIVWVN